MSAKPKHKKSIIDTGVRLFRRQGYARTGLNQICEESGAPKGSVYHYFPRGKNSIAVATITEASERVLATLHALRQECSNASELVQAHAALLAGWMKKSGYRDGCPITTVLLELAPQERLISRAGQTAYGARIEMLADQFKADGYDENKAASLALLCTSALQGSLIQARVFKSSAPITETAGELAALINQS